MAFPGGRKLSIHKALPEPIPPKKAVEGGLRRDGGHRRNVPLPEDAVRAGQQLPCQPPAPGLRVGGHRVQVGGPVPPLPRYRKGGFKPGSHGLDHAVLLQQEHPLRLIIGVVEVVHIGPVIPEGQLPQFPLPGYVLRPGYSDLDHRLVPLSPWIS